MKKYNVNDETIALFNALLCSGMQLQDIAKEIGVSRSWFYNCLNGYTFITKLEKIDKTMRISKDRENIIKSLKDKLFIREGVENERKGESGN